jgi:hypothetical protein
MHCDYLNGFIWEKIGFQESKHEERIDENSGTNPVEVHTHNLVSVCSLCNIGKTETFMLYYSPRKKETFMLFCMHCDYLTGFIWPKMGFRIASMKRKLMRFQAAILLRFTRTIWLVFVGYATLRKPKPLMLSMQRLT